MSSPVPSTDAPTKAAPSTIEFEPPLACVRRILKQSLPKSTHCGKDASQAFTRACGIFVIYLTTCANDIARENKRQTITANDVLAAIKELDFDEFTPELQEFLAAYRATEKQKKEAKAAAKAAADEASPKEAPKKPPATETMSAMSSIADPETEGDDDDKTLETHDTVGDDDKTHDTAASGDDDKTHDTNDDAESKETGAEKEETEPEPMEE